MKEGKYFVQGTLMFFAIVLAILFIRFISTTNASKTTASIADNQNNAVFNGYQESVGKGELLFRENCSACHAKHKSDYSLEGITDRIPDRRLLIEWIKNPQKVLASGNKYFNDLYIQYNKTPMSASPHLSDEDVEAILLYMNTQ